MPGYTPELNPVELLNGDIKRHVAQTNPGNVAELTAAATAVRRSAGRVRSASHPGG